MEIKRERGERGAWPQEGATGAMLLFFRGGMGQP